MHAYSIAIHDRKLLKSGIYQLHCFPTMITKLLRQLLEKLLAEWIHIKKFYAREVGYACLINAVADTSSQVILPVQDQCSERFPLQQHVAETDPHWFYDHFTLYSYSLEYAYAMSEKLSSIGSNPVANRKVLIY